LARHAFRQEVEGARLDGLAADPLRLQHGGARPRPPAPAPPSARNWLGTDDQSRDVLARVIYGFRISVLFGFTLTIAASSSASPPAPCRASTAG
jgi:ABC-type dipeptide/oligopeptide/nickel transport system permease subunit